MNRKRMFVLGLALAAILLLAACMKPESRVTRENYDKLTLGMAYPAVVAILGEPGDAGSQFGLRYSTWVDEGRQIHAKFIAGKAVYYSSKGLEEASAGH